MYPEIKLEGDVRLDLDLNALYEMRENWMIDKIRFRLAGIADDLSDNFIVQFIQDGDNYLRSLKLSLANIDNISDCVYQYVIIQILGRESLRLAKNSSNDNLRKTVEAQYLEESKSWLKKIDLLLYKSKERIKNEV